MKKKTALLFILLNSIFLGLTAQVSLPTDVHFNIKPLGLDSALAPVADGTNPVAHILANSDSVEVFVSMILVDTNVTNKIHIKLGSSEGQMDLLDQVFTYGNTNPGGGYSYYSDRQLIKIGLGVYSNIQEFCGEIKLEDHTGNLSSPVHVHPYSTTD